jgi:hypothetical protein
MDKQRKDDPCRTGTVILCLGEKLSPPPEQRQLLDLNQRHGKPGHRRAYLKRRCAFCGNRMRSQGQRTNHSSECQR